MSRITGDLSSYLVHIVHIDLHDAEVWPEHGGLGPVEQLLVQQHGQAGAVPEVHHKAFIGDHLAEVVSKPRDAEHTTVPKK